MATGQYIGVASKKITLTNLVPAMSSLSFAVGSSSGTCEMSTAHTKYGSTALCNTGVAGYNEMYSLSSQKFQLIPDHFYYACVEVYQETKLGSIDYFWPSGSPSIFGGQATGNAGTWKKLSNVTTRSSFTSGDYPIRLDFNNGGTAGKAWFDGLMLIDLTEAFGAGNEPGNAWCQENIPYFTGTTTVERYTESGVARKVVSSYIGVEGVARNVKSGYVGVNGVARLFFAPDDGGAAVLEVEKITSDTYANSTTYTAEEFILLDIYPKTGGTVKVTYGGLTKTITDTSGAEEPNAQQVFFGTFNGVTDSVATPSSGTLTIEGDYYAFGCGFYAFTNKLDNYTCICVVNILDFGNVEIIPNNAFGVVLVPDNPKRLTGEIIIPSTVKSIGEGAFLVTKITSVTISNTVSVIGKGAFNGCSLLSTVKMLGSVPPKLIGQTDTDGTTSYTNFGVVGSEAFGLTEIIVPLGCGNAYKTATGWATYADYIVEAT